MEITLSALAKEVQETEIVVNWGRALVAKIDAVENPIHRSVLYTALAKNYMSSFNSMSRQGFKRIVDEQEQFADPEEIKVTYNTQTKSGADITESQVRSANVRIARRIERWNEMLSQIYFHPRKGSMKLADLTKNEMREVSLYQKELIQKSVQKNRDFDKFVESIPDLYADVCARNLPEEKVIEAIDTYMAA